MDQVVLIRNGGAIRIGEKICRIENRVPFELVVAVARGEPIVLREGVIDPAQGLPEIFIVRLQKGHCPIRTQWQARQNLQRYRVDRAGSSAWSAAVQVSFDVTRRARRRNRTGGRD